MHFTNKKYVVLGLAKSGFAAAKLLRQKGAEVIVNDRNSLDGNTDAEKLKQLGVEVIGGGHPEELLDSGIDWIVKNPGIPYHIPFLAKAKEKGIPIITEVELAGVLTDSPFIGITGSNGKTTTTTLIHHMLKEAELEPLLAGNIGTVACEVAESAKEKQPIVIELSSFQLMGIESFTPKIAVLLNLFEAHLDYHGTKADYAAAKARIFMNQTEDDYAIINADDKEVVALAADIGATKLYFSIEKEVADGVYIADEKIIYQDEAIIELKDIVLPGKHNLQNILAAVAAAKLSGASNEAITRVLTSFKGVEHRMQYVTELAGRRFYNDSKATNILATSAALTAFDQPVILLAGGLDRGNDFDDLVPYLNGVKAMITYGETAPKLIDAARIAGIKEIKHVDTVEQAVPAAYEASACGDVILLSPACASWDQFKTFEERGDMFVQCVHKLK